MNKCLVITELEENLESDLEEDFFIIYVTLGKCFRFLTCTMWILIVPSIYDIGGD